MSIGMGKRREKRVAAVLPIRLWGLDANGRPFIEASSTGNVSRSGALLRDVPAKLAVGDIIGLRCKQKKYRFRVVWTGKQGTSEAGSVGLQCLDSGSWIWEDLRLSLDDVDIYARPPAGTPAAQAQQVFLVGRGRVRGHKSTGVYQRPQRGRLLRSLEFPVPGGSNGQHCSVDRRASQDLDGWHCD